MRLDKYLVEYKNIESRNKAQVLIENNLISVNGVITTKNNFDIKKNDIVDVVERNQFVSRAGTKLEHAINLFNINFKNKNVVDIGSSTGGFVEVALKNGANIVYAIDVGSNQLHHSLRNNEKVKVMENTNFKDVNTCDFNDKIDIITCDVSFISSKEILKKIKEIFDKKLKMIFLLKPQFEAGKDIVAKYKGFVPEKYHKKIIQDYFDFCHANKINILKIERSPITGAKLGNIEYLIYLEVNNE